MAKDCETCVYNSDYKATECYTCEVSYLDGVQQGKPSNYKAKPMTNADRIRAMSDEELAECLYQCKFCDICEEGCEDCTYHGDCEKRLLDWLQQPPEGE